jgi:hypothetical protein
MLDATRCRGRWHHLLPASAPAARTGTGARAGDGRTIEVAGPAYESAGCRRRQAGSAVWRKRASRGTFGSEARSGKCLLGSEIPVD